MIPEKMQELIILTQILEETRGIGGMSDVFYIKGRAYNREEMRNRRFELLKEFLEPYVIDKIRKDS